MAQVICPFCLKTHNFLETKQCSDYPEETIPDTFIEEYNTAPPPLAINCWLSSTRENDLSCCFNTCLKKNE